MLEAHSDSGTAAVTQARIVFGRHCLPWSDGEMLMLRTIAPRVCKRATLEKLFPGRSLKAVKKQLSKVREEMGCARSISGARCAGPAVLDPNDEGIDDGEERAWRHRCKRSNDAYIAAMRRAGFHWKAAA